MNNIQQVKISESALPVMSKLDRLQQRALRLQNEAQQARERLRVEEALQEKQERLKARRKAELEVRRLGVAAWVAGLREMSWQLPGSANDQEQPLDIDLLIGLMAQLREQISGTADTTEVANVRVRGEALRKDYFADKNNPRFSVSIISTRTCGE